MQFQLFSTFILYIVKAFMYTVPFGFIQCVKDWTIKADSNFTLAKTRNWLKNQVFKKVIEGIQKLRR